ncbi:hypothetical protein Tco_0726911 [Tanacetum coccineum]|uniref:Uncharacterized protein n=1 Tax=Tanacetum coccineum TaxID=301880 RepID=A0ABQ4YHW0_9ASTR
MIILKDSVFNRTEKTLMLKMSLRMDGMEEGVLVKEAQENLITVNGPKTSQPSMDLSETESEQVTRYVNGLSHEIQDIISLIPVYTLDDAYNLAFRAENQLAKRTCPSVFSSRNNSLSIQSTSKPEKSQYGSKSVKQDRKVNLTLKEDEYDEEEENDGGKSILNIGRDVVARRTFLDGKRKVVIVKVLTLFSITVALDTNL